MSLKKKFDNLDKLNIKNQNTLEKELLIEYSKALKSTRNSLAELFAKYSSDGKLTYEETIKYNRLKKLEKDINKQLSNLGAYNRRKMNTTLKEMYDTNYFYTGYILESESQLKLAYSILNPKLIEKSVSNPLMNISIENNTDYTKRKIRSAITQGLIQGSSYAEIAKGIKKAMESSAKNTITMARTETHRVQAEARQGSLEYAQSKGLEMLKVWVSSLDERTRDSHRALDGQKVGIDKNFVSPTTGAIGLQPGMMNMVGDNINCRCRSIVEFKGYETEQAYRRARNVTGNKVIPYKTFTDWHENRIFK